MPDLPKISIVAVSFNQAEFLEEAILSVLNQRYDNLEFLVVDGGSTDGSVEIIRKYEGRLDYWQSKRDGGHRDAINQAFPRCTGDLMNFLNSDDVFLPGAFHQVARYFQKTSEAEWITGDCMKFDCDEFMDAIEVHIPKSHPEWLQHCPLYQPSTFFSKRLFEKYGPFDESLKYSHDFEYWVRLAFGGEKVHYLPRQLSAYRLHSASNTVSARERFEQEDELIRQKYLRQLSASEHRKFVSLRANGLLLREAFGAIDMARRGEKDRAWKALISVVRRKPSLALNRSVIGAAVRIFRA